MNREDLRKVSYSIAGHPYEGYFHQWVIKKELDNGSEYAVALIEDKTTGAVHEIERGYILFHD